MSRLAALVLGAGLTTSVREGLRAALPSGSPRWTRTNYRDRQVSLTGGLGTAAGSVGAALGAGGPAGTAAAVVTTAAGMLGALDDQSTDAAADKGLRGHLRALAEGRLTSGGAKLLGISGAAVLAAAVGTNGGQRCATSAGPWTRGVDVLSTAALIAGTANLLNLFDLRPGRALKVAGALSLLPALSRNPGAGLATGALAVAVTSAPPDLAEETMLGDAGANALGALVGMAWGMHPDPGLRTGALAGVLIMTMLSEKVSFSRVIEAAPPLRALDTWGRSG